MFLKPDKCCKMLIAYFNFKVFYIPFIYLDIPRIIFIRKTKIQIKLTLKEL